MRRVGFVRPVRSALCAAFAIFLAADLAAAKPRPEVVELRRAGARGALPIVAWDESALARGERLEVRGLPLDEGRSVDLELEPFTVTRADTRFVWGRADGADEPLDFDPASVSLFRGSVAGEPGSRAFLTRHRGRVTGWVTVDGGARRFLISARDEDGNELAPGRSSVFEAPRAAELPPHVPFCGTDTEALSVQTSEASAPLATQGAGGSSTLGQSTLELAVDTDHEFFVLFEDGVAAAAYLVALYAQVSDIYIRDVNTRVDLVFVRLWDTPNDLFNNVATSPLSEFRSTWNATMGAVQRDVVQLLSGRRDYPFGGQAYLSSICGSSQYSVVGYAQGFFPDPSVPSPFNYDISVTAHEIGHNAGTGHSHDSPNFVDTCDDPLTVPQRGSIMSYCGQTWSGGNANRDLYFHSVIQGNMESFLGGASCVVDDCNENGVADSVDVAGASPDTNTNGIPDECEDCNGNLTLDPQDISGGASLDLNSNAIPDGCEADCNGNFVPDDRDIALGTSTDAYGDDIPDECETDCNTNGTSDYTEIQADMTLDVDRNGQLDACQDCDTDGTPDLDALAGSHDLWLASGLSGEPLRRFHAATGVLITPSSGATPDEAQDLIVVGSRVLVTSAGDSRVLEFGIDGSFVGDLVTTASGGLAHPTGLLMTAGGTLLVASHDTNEILAFDGSSGASLGAFVSAGSGGLVDPFGIAIGPNGNLYVATGADEVLEYGGTTGAFVQVFVSAANNGGLSEPRGILFKPDRNLLVTSYGTDQTLEFQRDTGAPLGRWAISGTVDRLDQISPWGLRIGPNGNVFIVRTGEAFGSGGGGGGHDHGDGELHLTNAQMYEFDIRTGGFLRSHVNGNDHGMEFPTGFDFVPGWSLDCNRNQLPDSCDISSGASLDGDGGGVPDECEIDCNGNTTLDRLDLIPFGTSMDCNANRIPDECDTLAATPGACEAGVELSCTDGFDNDRDGWHDCFDPDCNGVTCSAAQLLAARFAGGTDGFGYADDTFRSTNEPAYASGAHDLGGGFEGDGALRVDLGGIDGIDIFGMSGGFQTSLVVPTASDLELSFRYRLVQSGDYESNETSQVMVSFDGVLFGSDGNDYVADMNGDGNGGVALETGWQTFTTALGGVAAGSYPLVLGGYNSAKTTSGEFTEIHLDDVAVIQQLPPACGDGADNDGDGLTDAADPGCDDGADLSERSPALECDDGEDNDSDGGTDFDPDPGEGDPGCQNPMGNETPACQDGTDNDGDGGVDYDGGTSIHGSPIAAADPQCGNAWRTQERPYGSTGGCGLGGEVALALLALRAVSRRRRRKAA